MARSMTRILGIAPYEGMRTAMERVAEEYPDIQLEVYTGDLDEGVRIMEEHRDDNFDAIISRGGTAGLIGKATDIPVISIQLSVYDILRAIKMAEGYSSLYAIVGFPDITEPAHTLCDLLRMDVDIITVHSASEVDDTLDRLKLGGYKMVIGDMITHTLARQKGLDAFLITSGLESFHDALKQAVLISERFYEMRQENLLLKKISREKNGNTIVLYKTGEIRYYTQDAPVPELLELLRTRISEIPLNTPLKFYHNDHGKLYRILARTLRIGDETYYSFHYQLSQIPLRSGKNGIRSFSEMEVTQLFMSSFYSVSGAMGDLDSQLNAVASTRQPVMILGELGTGKEQIARALYLRSSRVKSPFVVIDCSLMTDKGWEFLLSHYGSPLNDDNGTIYFQNLDVFPEQYRQELLAVIAETDLSKRLRLIFSCTWAEGDALSETEQLICTRLGCLTLRLPPLRSRTDELPSLATLYLSNLNMELGKQIIGFDSQAMEQLRSYDWPNNYTQFKQVLQELATLTNSAYIRRSAVIDVLSRERSIHRKSQAPNTEREFAFCTLEEITRSAIQQTLDALGGNQTAAAKQLGISRTTLWRYLTPKDK